MSGFKDQVAADLDVFINSDEFAEEHDLNGMTVRAVVQSPTSQERWINGVNYSIYDRRILYRILSKSRFDGCPSL